VEHLGRANDEQRLARVYVVPALWGLSQRIDSRIFQEMNAIQVVRSVLRAAGVYTGRLEVELRGEYLTREYCTQYRESDLAFVLRLLAEEGVTFFFRHDEDGERLVLTDHVSVWGHVDTLDREAVPVVGAEAVTHRVETVRHLHVSEEQRSTSVLVRDFDFTRPRADVQGRSEVSGADERPVYEFASDAVLANYSNPVYGAENTEAQARRRLEALRATARSARGRSNVTGMLPGAKFALQHHEHDDLNRELLVVSAEHWGHAPEATAQETQQAPEAGASSQRTSKDEDRYHNELVCIASDVTYRPPRNFVRPTIAGIQTATVVGPAGEEIHTDEHGRIKVQFHWDREGQRNERSSCWVRVVQGTWAGTGWGSVTIPRISMEAVVSFVEGNPDRPVVTGTLFNGANRPPYDLPAERAKNTFRTSSTPGNAGFNELRMDDTADAEEIFLHAQNDWNTVVLHDRTQRVDNDETRNVGHDERLTVDNDQTNTIHPDRIETVDNDHKETIGNNRSLHVVANDTENIDANRTVTVGANYDETTQANRSMSVVSNLAVTVMANKSETVALMSNEMVGVLKAVEVVGPYEVMVGAHHGVQVVGNISASSNASISVSAGAKTSVSSKDDITITGDKKAVISIHDQLTLVCGDASVILKRNGDVKIKGKTIQVEGSGDVIIRGSKVGVN
jgi:type VI secretion system secreted protein VgrG